jgi:hypothetical protein
MHTIKDIELALRERFSLDNEYDLMSNRSGYATVGVERLIS